MHSTGPKTASLMYFDQVLLNISSAAVHANPAPRQAAYSASKAGMATLFQHLADEVDPRTLQILNIHPGAVFTEAAERHGFTKDSLPWDDGMSSSTFSFPSKLHFDSSHSLGHFEPGQWI